MKGKNGKTIAELGDVGANTGSSNVGKSTSKLYGGVNATHVGTWEQAQAMLNAGDDPEVVRQKTGWFRGKYDDMPRFEIDDSKAESGEFPDWEHTRDGRFRKTTLGQILKHDALFKAYPQLKDMPVQLISEQQLKGNKASYHRSSDGSVGHITLSESNTEAEPTEMANRWRERIKALEETSEYKDHEKKIMSMNYTSPDFKKELDGFRKTEVGKEIESLNDLLRGQGSKRYGKKLSSAGLGTLLHEVQHAIQHLEGFPISVGATFDEYVRSPHEIEATEVEERVGLSDAERKQRKPHSTAEVSKEQAYKGKAPKKENQDSLDKSSSKLYGGLRASSHPAVGTWEQAHEMFDAGDDPEEIRRKTGWFKGRYDAMPRFEIDDSVAEFTPISSAFSEDVTNIIRDFNDNGLLEKLEETHKNHPALSKGELLFGVSPEFPMPESVRILANKLGLDTDSDNPRLGKEREKVFDAIFTGNPTHLPTPKTFGQAVASVVQERTVQLDEIIKHDTLFATYPELREVKVEILPKTVNATAQFDPMRNTISIAPHVPISEATSSALHEIQHWIQEKEGFMRGTNVTEQFLKQSGKAYMAARKQQLITQVAAIMKQAQEHPDIREQSKDQPFPFDKVMESTIATLETGNVISEKEKKSILKQRAKIEKLLALPMDELNRQEKAARAKMDKLFDKRMETAQKAYKLTPGEIESREVQARRLWSPEQRKIVVPYSTENIPYDEATIDRPKFIK